ncbi:phage major capsid protein [Acetobacterium sp.]|uniref:phage major capsid protein n=1 Tax=Acetobacterium sp. TaxID=1872094 RepID=UPI002F42AC41
MTRAQYEAMRKALIDSAQEFLTDGDVEGSKGKQLEVVALDNSFELIGKEQANLNALTKNTHEVKAPLLDMSGDGEIIDKIEGLGNTEKKYEDKFASVEYRHAYMQNVLKNVPIPAKYNIDTFSTIVETAALIPTTVMAEIIREIKTYGQLYARVRKMAIKGGIEVPISSLIPVATWITEGTPSERQKGTVNTSVSFKYFGLECKIATSLLADVVTLSSFETTMVTLIAEAMIKAIDKSIIAGAGTGSCLGVTIDPRVVAGQVLTVSSADFASWDGWKKKVFAKIKLSYRAGGSFIMAAGTFDGYIDGMVDANGQPIGRTNYGITDGPQERFAGKEVILVEDDIVADYETAAAGDIVAIYMRLSDYAINSNLSMATFRWLDQDLNQYVNKAIMIIDGKLLDAAGVLIIKKGA